MFTQYYFSITYSPVITNIFEAFHYRIPELREILTIREFFRYRA